MGGKPQFEQESYMGKNAGGKSNGDVIDKVESEFVTPQHRLAIEEASVKGKFAVSFRAAGAATLAALEEGAAAKGHDILEKTIKQSSLAKAYPNNAAEMLQKVREAGIEGYVGHWDKASGELKGIYLSSGHGLGDKVQGNIYPIDMNRLDESLAPLKQNPGWKALPFTGDYDMHDMLTFRGAGRPHTPLVDSKEELAIRKGINQAVADVDPRRPVADTEHNVIRHGPQVNFSSYMLDREAGVVKRDGGFLGVVARPGEFPVAMVDRGKWSIINDSNQLAGYYRSVGAQIKETWNPDGVRTFADADKPGMVKYGRRDETPAKPPVPAAPKPAGNEPSAVLDRMLTAAQGGDREAFRQATQQAAAAAPGRELRNEAAASVDRQEPSRTQATAQPQPVEQALPGPSQPRVR
ncbi:MULTISPECIES: Insecticial toxin [Lysobacter]|uniref:Insecticial toxin n=1 Tax=Lysobacter firmicutimachus TaxID=1792846 RepID=A0ABU8D010_9GAMM|nr:Insecticial toxin [Lysobacter antibioticus]